MKSSPDRTDCKSSPNSFVMAKCTIRASGSSAVGASRKFAGHAVPICRGLVHRNQIVGISGKTAVSAIKPDSTGTHLFHGTEVVAYKQDGSTRSADIFHFFKALPLEGDIPDSQNFVNDEDFRL